MTAASPAERRRTGATAAVGILLVAVAVTLRVNALPFISSDMRGHLLPWYLMLTRGGDLLATNFADYTPAYLYLLWAAAHLHEWLPAVLAIKLISIAFDVAIGAMTYLIVRAHGRGARYAVLGALSILSLPTIWMNSARWGQCDAIFATFILACVYGCLRQRPFAAMLAFSVALSIKLQAVFLVPFLMLEQGRRRSLLRYLWLPIVVYLVVGLPALLAGRTLFDLVMIYPRQMQLYTDLSMWAPNLWGVCYLRPGACQGWPAVGAAWLLVNGIVIATVLVLARRRQKVLHTPRSTLLMATASVLIVPFLLPRMHDRYFFLADVLSFILALCEPRLWYVAAGVQAASITAYGSIMYGWPIEAVAVGTMLNAACIVAVLWHLATDRHLAGRPVEP
jgi:Gpi18-like mannosyltransferase